MRLPTDILRDRLNRSSMSIASGTDTNDLQDTLMGIPPSEIRAMLAELTISGKRNFWFTVFRVLDSDSAFDFLNRFVIRPTVDEMVLEETKAINTQLDASRELQRSISARLTESQAMSNILRSELDVEQSINADLREYRQAATDKAAAAEAELSDAMATIRTLTKLGETT